MMLAVNFEFESLPYKSINLLNIIYFIFDDLFAILDIFQWCVLNNDTTNYVILRRCKILIYQRLYRRVFSQKIRKTIPSEISFNFYYTYIWSSAQNKMRTHCLYLFQLFRGLWHLLTLCNFVCWWHFDNRCTLFSSYSKLYR